MIIDFSSHDAWAKCPALWYEKYINRRRKHWPSAQRDDALCLGSLVHEGLRLWQETHTVGIPQAVQDEMTPTKECYDLALELVYGYARAYPEEQWPLILCEEPVTFPLKYDSAKYGVYAEAYLQGLAKIDAYFYVPDYTEVETGLGIRQMLQPGWWIHEYKTKSPFIGAGLYMQSWEMGLQASYQIMALANKLANEGGEDYWRTASQVGAAAYHGTVQGVLVNVLEKPRRTVPKRRCLTCQEYYEFATWLPTGTGMYACPTCGSRQKLQPLKQDTPMIPPAYYRIVVTRTPQELARDRAQIIQVGHRMQEMAANGLYSEPWNKHACVDFRWRSTCPYYGPHKNFASTVDDPDYESVPDYRGLAQLEGDTA